MLWVLWGGGEGELLLQLGMGGGEGRHGGCKDW